LRFTVNGLKFFGAIAKIASVHMIQICSHRKNFH